MRTQGEWTIQHYETAQGKNPYGDWFSSLKDLQGKAAIRVRLDRIAAKGNFGLCRLVGGGVWELKVDVGPGYRVYYGLDRTRREVILLAGGDKSTQVRDIASAKERWEDFNA